MGLAKLLSLAREQGFKVVDKEGAKRLCRASETIGSRLTTKMECYTPERWKKMAADTPAKSRDDAGKQIDPSGG